MAGSVLAGDAQHRLDSLETDLEIEGDVEVDVVRSIVAQAERMCFVLDAVERPHDVVRRTSVNGVGL